MKKGWKMLAAIGLIAAISATSVSAAPISLSGQKAETVAAQSVTTQAASIITPNNMTTGFEKTSAFPVHQMRYNQSQLVSIENTMKPGVVQAIKIPAKGQLCIDASALTGSAIIAKSCRLVLYSDAKCTSKVDNTIYLSSVSDLSKPKLINVPKGQTYYLAFYTDYLYNDSYTNKIDIQTYFYSGADRTLTSGKWIGHAAGNYGSPRYYKINMSSAGHIVVEATQSQTIEICNSKKSLLFSSNYVNSASNKKLSYYLNKGTYYIRTPGSTNNSVSSLRYTAYKLGSKPYVLTNKKMQKVYAASGAYQYLKYKATATGYVTVTTAVSDNMYVALCNSSRKALTDDQYVNGSASSYYNKKVYGVKKGQTYYVRVKEGTSNPISVKLTQTAVKEKSGSSKKKAVSVKAKKTVKGSIAAGSSEADWYKFKLTKNKKVTIRIKGSCVGTLNFKVYTSSGKQVGSATISGNGCDKELSTYYGKMPKGTYYMKVQRNDKVASGYYSINWR